MSMNEVDVSILDDQGRSALQLALALPEKPPTKTTTPENPDAHLKNIYAVYRDKLKCARYQVVKIRITPEKHPTEPYRRFQNSDAVQK
jgi:hypothetical protein